MADLPFVGQKFWGNPLNTAIEERTSSEGLADRVKEPGPLRDELMDTFVAQEDTGTAGLAVLAANLPAEAREALGITVDTTVGTRVFVGDVMIYGDTGPRNLISGIPEGWTFRSDRIVLRRSGNWCSLQFGFMTQLSGQQTLYDGLPLGFRPDALVTSSALVPFSGDSKGRVLVSRQNITVTGTVPSAVWADVTMVWPTSDPWPTTLPGIPL